MRETPDLRGSLDSTPEPPKELRMNRRSLLKVAVLTAATAGLKQAVDGVVESLALAKALETPDITRTMKPSAKEIEDMRKIEKKGCAITELEIVGDGPKAGVVVWKTEWSRKEPWKKEKKWEMYIPVSHEWAERCKADKPFNQNSEKPYFVEMMKHLMRIIKSRGGLKQVSIEKKRDNKILGLVFTEIKETYKNEDNQGKSSFKRALLGVRKQKDGEIITEIVPLWLDKGNLAYPYTLTDENGKGRNTDTLGNGKYAHVEFPGKKIGENQIEYQVGENHDEVFTSESIHKIEIPLLADKTVVAATEKAKIEEVLKDTARQ